MILDEIMKKKMVDYIIRAKLLGVMEEVQPNKEALKMFNYV